MRLVTNTFRLAVGLLLVLLFVVNAYPQTGVVTRPINLIVDPGTDEPPIRLLLPPEAFRLVAPKEQSGFFRIRTEAGETGWVLKEVVSLYNRKDWRHWTRPAGDCQDTRQKVLIRDSTIPVVFNPNVCIGKGEKRRCDCRVQLGQWIDPYGGEVFTDPANLQIDHVVPLAHAHVTGGWAWTPERREAFANDLENKDHLLAVKGSLNQSKGDKSPDKWKPPRQAFWCEYATIWLRIKERWNLMLRAIEASAIVEMMRTCHA